MAQNSENLKEALLYAKLDGDKVQCNLCGWRCMISDGSMGRCMVRQNIGGTLYSLNYHKLCAAGADPIEKKPMFHFQPSTKSFSIAAAGCNFKCQFCQNFEISQADEGGIAGRDISPESVVALAVKSGCKSIAYTYTEPTVFMEIANDCGQLARDAGLKNVFVSNGFMTKEAIDLASGWLDAINIDLKSFSEDYYENLCRAKLQPVLDTIEYIAANTDIWMEITTLIVPGENDSEDELRSIAEFIVKRCGPDTPWHISRFYPQYHYTESVPTPTAVLQKAESIAKQAGLRYVYTGNVRSARGENTYCQNCEKLLIKRQGFYVAANNIENGKCPDCQTKIAGVEM